MLLLFESSIECQGYRDGDDFLVSFIFKDTFAMCPLIAKFASSPPGALVQPRILDQNVGCAPLVLAHFLGTKTGTSPCAEDFHQ